jgi:predicted nucleotidyltransferase
MSGENALLDLAGISDDLRKPVTKVVEAALDANCELSPEKVMVVGAWCRDIIHSALGHTFSTAATRDLDLALALSSWDAYQVIATRFPLVGDTGIRFRIGDADVDLLPFGAIENPQGIAEPPLRADIISVWAFEEIYRTSLPLPLSTKTTIRLPAIAGYAALKLGAWLDRSAWLEVKDAPDLALILYWYSESSAVHDRLYETPTGNEILIAEQMDIPLAAARLLGIDIASTIGTERLAELLARWPGDADLLTRELRLRSGPNWPREAGRRRDLLDALTLGLTTHTA